MRFLLLFLLGTAAYGQVHVPSSMSTDQTKIWSMGGVTLGSYGAITGKSLAVNGITIGTVNAPVPVATKYGATGTTTWQYKVTAMSGALETDAGYCYISNGVPTLTALNYVRVSWPLVRGATSYKVYKYITAVSQYRFLKQVYGASYSDTAVDSYTTAVAPTTNQTGKISGVSISGNADTATTAGSLSDNSGTGSTLAWDSGALSWITPDSIEATSGFYGNLTGNLTGHADTATLATNAVGLLAPDGGNGAGIISFDSGGSWNVSHEIQAPYFAGNLMGDVTGNADTATNLAGTKTANYVYAGPTTGAAANPTFRALVSADFGATVIPDSALSANVPLKNGTNTFSAVQTISNANFPVLQVTRAKTSGGAYTFGALNLELTNTTPTAGNGIGTFLKAPNAAGTSTYAGSFGACLPVNTAGAERGRMDFTVSPNGYDPSTMPPNLSILATDVGANVGVGISTPSSRLHVTGNAPSSVAGNGAAATPALTVTGAAGGASSGTTGQTGGAGASVVLTGGAGGAVAGAGGIGGAGGNITLTPGAGGAGASTNGAAGKVIIAGEASFTGPLGVGQTKTVITTADQTETFNADTTRDITGLSVTLVTGESYILRSNIRSVCSSEEVFTLLAFAGDATASVLGLMYVNGTQGGDDVYCASAFPSLHSDFSYRAGDFITIVDGSVVISSGGVLKVTVRIESYTPGTTVTIKAGSYLQVTRVS